LAPGRGAPDPGNPILSHAMTTPEFIAWFDAKMHSLGATVTSEVSKRGIHQQPTDGRRVYPLQGADRRSQGRCANIPSERRQAMGVLPSATPACRCVRPRPDFTRSQFPHSPPLARIDTRNARRADGRDSCATWAFRHANDREALRALGAVLCRRHHPRKLSKPRTNERFCGHDASEEEFLTPDA
jgi:hypothetical protein